VDARLTDDQVALRDVVDRMVRDSAPSSVRDLGDRDRTQRLAEHLRDAGLLALRDESEDTGVEVALVAERLAFGALEVAFVGPTLAKDLCRRAGVAAPERCTVALAADMAGLASDVTLDGALAFDSAGAEVAVFLVPGERGHGLATAAIVQDVAAVDLTRSIARPEPVSSRELAPAGALDEVELLRWTAFGRAILAADLLGSARAAHELTVAHAKTRLQYGRPVAAFQAVQHLLAESLVLIEGAQSAVSYAAWASDREAPDAAHEASLVAKVYCGIAARTVNETAIQVHGGIGNTWECMVHIHLRRALQSGQALGSDGDLLDEIADLQLGVG